MTIEEIEEIIGEYEECVHSCAIDYIAGPLTIEYGKKRIKKRNDMRVILLEAIKQYKEQK